MRKLLPAMQAFLVIWCSVSCNIKQKTLNQLAFKAQRERIVEEFPKIPHDELLQQIAGNRLYSELQESYKNSLIGLKTSTDKDCARLVVVILSPEVGKNANLANTYGIPYIIRTCDNMGVDFFDFSPKFADTDINNLLQVVEEGCWTKTGSVYVADLLDTVLNNFDDQESSKKHIAAASRPATFGDLPPHQDEVIEGNNDMPYHVKVNGQGLRMDHDLTFPKKKQTILILSDDKIYSPFLNNEFIATAILQKRHPDKEIVNAAVSNYTMDDYESLYREKARFTEPDLVIVVTDGSDILDYYFSHRNRYSRSPKIFMPSKISEEFYNLLYKNKNID